MGPPVGEPNAGRQESARSNEIAELRHRDASRSSRSIVSTQRYTALAPDRFGSGWTKDGDDGCASNVLA